MNKPKKKFILTFLILVVVISLLTSSTRAFVWGVIVSGINMGLYWGFYAIYCRRIPRYSGHSLTLVISTTLTRFVVVGCLLVLGFHRIGFDPKPLLLGFVLGQLFFLLHQLTTVATNNVK